VPRDLRQRVLLWGVLGALVLRAGFILAGAALLQRFHWVAILFGALLVYTGVKLFLRKEAEVDLSRNRALLLARRLVPAVPDYRGPRFLVREGGRLLATPLAFVLIAVEASDIVFAVDSIPAVFAV